MFSVSHPLVRAAVVAVMLLAACAQSVAEPVASPVTPPAISARGGILQAPVPDPAECQARGGQVRAVCRSRTQMCVAPYPDAGKACRGKADCQGRCLDTGKSANGAPVTGRCQAESDPCGCFNLVEDGKVAGGLCVD